MRPKQRGMLALVVIIAGLVFVVRSVQHSPDVEAPLPGALVREDTIRFSRPSKPETTVAVASDVASQIQTRAENLDFAPLSADDAASFAAAIEARVRVLLSGSFDAWIEDVERYTSRPDRREDGSLDDEIRKRWEGVAHTFSGAPVSLEETTVRPLFIRGRPVRHPPTGALSKPSLRAGYPRAAQDGQKTVYEAIVPMKLRLTDGSRHEFPAFVGLAYRKDDRQRPSVGGANWIPYDMTVYFYADLVCGFHLPFF